MAIVNLNGKVFESKDDLMQDQDFMALSEQAKNMLLAHLEGSSTSQDETQTPQNLVPASVTPRQFRLALVLSNISLDAIDNFINNLPSPQKEIAKITWEYSTEIRRDNAILNQMAPLMGITQEQLDQLFILASTLN